MILIKIFLLASLALAAFAAVTVNPITGVTTDNLLFSGTIPVSATDNLFFTYYGVDGQKDLNALKNYPLLVFVGKYFFIYPVLELLLNITHLEELDLSSLILI